MTRVAAEITGDARGQRRRSYSDRKDAPLQANECGLRRCSGDSARVCGLVNSLVEVRGRDNIMETADGGRQREVIREMSVEFSSRVTRRCRICRHLAEQAGLSVQNTMRELTRLAAMIADRYSLIVWAFLLITSMCILTPAAAAQESAKSVVVLDSTSSYWRVHCTLRAPVVREGGELKNSPR